MSYRALTAGEITEVTVTYQDDILNATGLTSSQLSAYANSTDSGDDGWWRFILVMLIKLIKHLAGIG
jgi:hypothetical protein